MRAMRTEKFKAVMESVASLRGVSTRYMPNYLAWMRTLEWFKDQGAKPEHFVLSGIGQQRINR
jgi:hypothetical protein